MGEGFIEAHHLKPISTLEEGVTVHYDIAADLPAWTSADEKAWATLA